MEENKKPQMNFTFNFNAPVGQQIAHVDKIEAHFDKDMNMQVIDVEHQGEAKAEGPRDEMQEDNRIKLALEKIIADDIIVNKYDYAMVLMVLEQELEAHFNNGQSFVNFLKDIGITHKEPGADSINKVMSKAKGQYPNWKWPEEDYNEVRRRNNIAKAFMSAYNKL